MTEANEIGVLVQFRANLGNLPSTLATVKNQLNQLTLTNTKLAQASGQMLPGLDQQITLLRALGAQGNSSAASMVKLAQGQKTFWSVFSGNVKQNLSAMFKSQLAVGQTMGSLKNELNDVQIMTSNSAKSMGHSFTEMGSLADNWALKSRTMMAVQVEGWHRTAEAMITAGKQAQWVGRQLMVGVTAPILALTYVLGKNALAISTQETELAKFMMNGTKSAQQFVNIVENQMSPALRKISEELGIAWQETTAMAASWAAAGYDTRKVLVPVTQLTEELAALAQGDIDVAQAQELVRTLMATYGLTVRKARQELEALQVIQSKTSLQMHDIASSLPLITSIGQSLGLNATQITAMLAGMRQLGVDSSVAANALKHSFAQMLAPTKEAADMFSSMFKGFSIPDFFYDPKTGEPRGTAAIEQLAKMFSELGIQERNTLAATMFGSRQYDRMLKLFNAMNNSSSDYNKSLEMTANRSENAKNWQEQLRVVMDSLQKTWERFKVEITNVAASLGKTFLPAIEDAANSFVNLLKRIDDVIQKFPSLANWLTKIAALMALVGPAIYAGGIFGKLLPGNLLSGVTALARKAVSIESIEAPGLLQTMAMAPLSAGMAGNSNALVGRILAGMPRGGIEAVTSGDIMAAAQIFGQTAVGTEGAAYPARTLFGQIAGMQQFNARNAIPGMAPGAPGLSTAQIFGTEGPATVGGAWINKQMTPTNVAQLAGVGVKPTPIVEQVPISVLSSMRGNNLSEADVQFWMEKIRKGEGIDLPIDITFDDKTGLMNVGEGNHRVEALRRLGFQSAPTTVSRGSLAPGAMGATSFTPQIRRDEYGWLPGQMAPSWVGMPTAGAEGPLITQELAMKVASGQTLLAEEERKVAEALYAVAAPQSTEELMAQFEKISQGAIPMPGMLGGQQVVKEELATMLGQRGFAGKGLSASEIAGQISKLDTSTLRIPESIAGSTDEITRYVNQIDKLKQAGINPLTTSAARKAEMKTLLGLDDAGLKDLQSRARQATKSVEKELYRLSTGQVMTREGLAAAAGISPDTRLGSVEKLVSGQLGKTTAAKVAQSNLGKELLASKFGIDVGDVDKLLKGESLYQVMIKDQTGALRIMTDAEKAALAKEAEILGIQSSLPQMLGTTVGNAKGKGTAASWIKWMFTGVSDAAGDEGDKVATTFLQRMKSQFAGPGKKGILASFLNLFKDVEATAVTMTPTGPTAILMKFTNFLPELIVLLVAATLILKNWRSIWEGLKGPMETVTNILKEIGQVWMDAFQGVFGIQDKGSEINEFWKELGKTVGDILVFVAELAKMFSKVLAPAIAGTIKIVLVAAEAFLKLVSIITEGPKAFLEFTKTGEGLTGILGKLIALVAVGTILGKVIVALVVAFKTLAEAETILAGATALMEGISTMGLSIVITGIALAVGYLVSSLDDWDRASDSLSTQISSQTETLKNFREELIKTLSYANEYKGKTFSSVADQIANLVSDTLSSFAENTDAAYMGAQGLNLTFKAMEPVLKNLNQLSEDQLKTLRQQTREIMIQIRDQKIAAEGQQAAAVAMEAAQAGLGGAMANRISQLPYQNISRLVALAGDSESFFKAVNLPLEQLGANLGLSADQAEAFRQQLLGNNDALTQGAQDVIAYTYQLNFLGHQFQVVFEEPIPTIDQLRDKIGQVRKSLQDTGSQAKNTGKDMAEAFKSALETQLAQVTDRITSAILEQFDKQTEAMTGAIDKQIAKIEKQNAKEEWLQQQREYRLQRQKMLYDQQLSMAQTALEREKALTEGRSDDARLLQLQLIQQQSQFNSDVKDLDKQHAKDVKDHQTQKRIDELNREKEKLQKMRDVQRRQLEFMLQELTEFGARSTEEFQSMYQQMQATARNYGVSITGVSHTFVQNFGRTLTQDLADAFRDAREQVARDATSTGKAIADGVATGISQSKATQRIQQAWALLAELQDRQAEALRHGADRKGPRGTSSQATQASILQNFQNSKYYIATVEKINKLISFHTGGHVDGNRDEVPAILQTGEYVINRRSAKKLGKKALDRLNNADKYHTGGMAGYGSGVGSESAHADKRKIFHTGGIAGAGSGVGRGNESHAEKRRIKMHDGGWIGDFVKTTAYTQAAALKGLAARNMEPILNTIHTAAASSMVNILKQFTVNALGGNLPPGGGIAPGTPSVTEQNLIQGAGPFKIFPVQGPHLYGDSFGAPRYAGGFHKHKGNDIIAPYGTPIVSPWEGNVSRNYDPYGGNSVFIDNPIGRVYQAHMSKFGKLGSVKPGDVVGYVGNTGDSPVMHDHFEFRPKNPAAWAKTTSPYGDRIIDGAVDPYPYLRAVDKNAHRGGIVMKNKMKPFTNLRFDSPTLLQSGETVLSRNVTNALNHIGANAATGGGDIVLNVQIDQMFGDDASYRKLYDTLERVGGKIARERGVGNNTVVRVGNFK